MEETVWAGMTLEIVKIEVGLLIELEKEMAYLRVR